MATLVARSFARQAFRGISVVNTRVGSVRMASYYTPGTYTSMSRSHTQFMLYLPVYGAAHISDSPETSSVFPPSTLHYLALVDTVLIGFLYLIFYSTIFCFYHPFICDRRIAHEYIKKEGKTATIGITDFAQSALGDIVFVDLPEVGDEFDKGDSFGSVESVKAASDVYAPVSGKVTEINENLSDEPGLVNQDAEGDAWFIKMEMTDDSELEGLMDADAYKEHCDKEA